MNRPHELTDFLHAVHAKLADTPSGAAAEAVDRIFAALQTQGAVEAPQVAPPDNGLSDTLSTHFMTALHSAKSGPSDISAIAAAFERLAPLLRWAPKAGSESNPDFHTHHANTAIVGPMGMEKRSDVIVGAGVVAPGTTYPKHSHPPEELYVVLSEGEWYRDERQWYSPGVGGIVYHPHGITHGMRALGSPLLAVWCLYVR